MILYLLALAAVIAAVEYLSLRRALDGVEYDSRPGKGIAEPGETVDLVTVVTNRRRRFLPFIRLNENVPVSIETAGDVYTESATARRGQLRSTLYLMPRQRLTRRTPFRIPKRGRYLFLGAKLNGGDFLGLSENTRTVELWRELVILPKAVDAPQVARFMGGWMGDRSVNRFIMEDPVLTLGFRDYTGHEPMKTISWTQTARAGRLMVKCQDYTVERTVTVLLNADTYAFDAYGDEVLDKTCSLCRGVCAYLEEQRVPYSFMTNARAAGMPDGFGQVGGGLGQAHLMTVLEALGRADGTVFESRVALIDRATTVAGLGRGFIYLTPVRHDVDAEQVETLRRASGEAPLVLVAEEAMAS